MKKTIPALFSTLLFVGATAFACDKHAAPTTATAPEPAAKKSCCKGEATTAAVAPDAAAVLTASADASAPCPMASARAKSDCKQGAKATTTAHKECPHAAAARTAAIAPEAEKTLAFSGVGKVMCARCDLKTSETCRSMFQTAEGTKVYGLCGDDLTEQLKKITQHGELDVTVHGRIVANASGELLCIEGFSVGTI